MDPQKRCAASSYPSAIRRTPRRVPLGDERGANGNSQLIILAVSLALWTLIIGVYKLMIG